MIAEELARVRLVTSPELAKVEDVELAYVLLEELSSVKEAISELVVAGVELA